MGSNSNVKRDENLKNSVCSAKEEIKERKLQREKQKARVLVCKCVDAVVRAAQTSALVAYHVALCLESCIPDDGLPFHSKPVPLSRCIAFGCVCLK